MKIEQLKQLAKEGKLKLNKYDMSNPFRKRHYYSCRTKDMARNESYKITAKDYRELERIIKLSTV